MSTLRLNATLLAQALENVRTFAKSVQWNFPIRIRSKGGRVTVSVVDGDYVPTMPDPNKPEPPPPTDLLSVSCSFEAKGDDVDFFTDASIITDVSKVAKRLKVPEVAIELIDGKPGATLKAGTTSLDIMAVVGPDRTPSAKVTRKNKIGIDPSTFRTMVNSLLPFVSGDVTREHLSAALFEFDPGLLRLVGTDGHRLAYVEGPVTGSVAWKKRESAESHWAYRNRRPDFLIPKSMLETIAKVSKSKGASTDISTELLESTQPVAGKGAKKGEQETIYGRIITCRTTLPAMTFEASHWQLNRVWLYPSWRQIIPSGKMVATRFEIEQPESMKYIDPICRLTGALPLLDDRVSARTNGITAGITADNKLGFVIEGIDVGVVVRSSRGFPGSPTTTIGFNAGYLLDAFRALKQGTVQMQVWEDLDPILMTGEAGNGVNMTVVVMPMRLGATTPLITPHVGEFNYRNNPVAAEHLAEMGAFAAATAEQKSSISVLENVVVTGGGGELSLLATDLESISVTKIPFDCPPFQSLVPAKGFESVFKCFPKGTRFGIDVSSRVTPALVDIDTLISVPLEKMPTDENAFPPALEFVLGANKPVGSLPGAQFTDLVKAVLPSISKDYARAHLGACRIEVEAGQAPWRMVATDGHRLTVASATGLNDQTTSVLVPRDTFVLLSKMFGGVVGTRDVSLRIGGKYCCFSVSGAGVDGVERSVTTKISELQFPSYRYIMPDGFVSGFKVAPDALTTALKKVTSLGSKNADKQYVQLSETDPGKLVIERDKFGTKATVPIEDFDGVPPMGHFMGQYLIDAFAPLSGQAEMLIGESTKNKDRGDLAPGPCVIRGWASPFVTIDSIVMGAFGGDAAPVDAPIIIARSDMPVPPIAPWGAGASKAKPVKKTKKPAKAKPASERRSARPAAASAGRLNILDPNAFAVMSKLEGAAWAAEEREFGHEENRFLDAQEAYRILVADGLAGTYMLADVAGSAGFVGAAGEIYVVLKDGEIAMFADTATPPKLAKVEKAVRVIRETKKSAARRSKKSSAKKSARKSSGVRKSKKSARKSSRKGLRESERFSVQLEASKAAIEGRTAEGEQLAAMLDRVANPGNPGLMWRPSADGHTAHILIDDMPLAQVTSEDGKWILHYSKGGQTRRFKVSLEDIAEWVQDEYNSMRKPGRPSAPTTPKRLSYTQARSRIFEYLRRQDWVVALFNTPQATPPGGGVRVYFKPKSVMIAMGNRLRLQDAHTIFVDIRDVNGPQFVALVEGYQRKYEAGRAAGQQPKRSVRESVTKFSDSELIALCALVSIKPSYRPEVFKDADLGEYGTDNPLIKSAIRKGLVTVNAAGSIMPDKSKINALLKQYPPPASISEVKLSRGCSNPCFHFNCKA